MTNPNYISGLDTANQIRDNNDAIHSGVIKALNSMAGGNMVIEGCNVTQNTSGASTRFDVANGKYLRDGALVTFSAANKSLNTSTNEHTNPAGVQTPSATLNYDYYLLLVFDSAGALQIRGDNTLINATTPAVASLTAGDTPICAIQIAGASTDSATRKIQYLTVDKITNNLNIAYDNSGTYTSTLSVTGAGTGTTIANAVGKLIIQDSVANFLQIDGGTMSVGGVTPANTLHVEKADNNAYLSLLKNTDSAGSNFAGGLSIHANGSTANHRFLQCYDYATSKQKLLFTSDGTMTITAHEATAATIKLQSDENDDAGDSWAFISNADQTFTIANDIASAGTHVAMITFTPHATPASSSVNIAGDLTVGGGDIIGPTDGSLTIKADTDLIFQVDSDGDGAETFQFKNGAGTEIAALDETGNLQIDGDLTISGNNITNASLICDGAVSVAHSFTTNKDRFKTRVWGGASNATMVNELWATAAANPFLPATEHIYAYPTTANLANIKGGSSGVANYGVMSLADPAACGLVTFTLRNLSSDTFLVVNCMGGTLPMNGGVIDNRLCFHADTAPAATAGALTGYTGSAPLAITIADAIILAPTEAVTLQAITEESDLGFLPEAGLQPLKTYLILSSNKVV